MGESTGRSKTGAQTPSNLADFFLFYLYIIQCVITAKNVKKNIISFHLQCFACREQSV